MEPLKNEQEWAGEVERHGTFCTSLCCKVSCKVFWFCCFFSRQLVLWNVFDSRYSKVELVEYLLERGMEVDALGEEGMTALHYVSRWVYWSVLLLFSMFESFLSPDMQERNISALTWGVDVQPVWKTRPRSIFRNKDVSWFVISKKLCFQTMQLLLAAGADKNKGDVYGYYCSSRTQSRDAIALLYPSKALDFF